VFHIRVVIGGGWGPEELAEYIKTNKKYIFFRRNKPYRFKKNLRLSTSTLDKEKFDLQYIFCKHLDKTGRQTTKKNLKSFYFKGV
jgi:hypothetical protein